jgi:uncharacterized protein YcnI
VAGAAVAVIGVIALGPAAVAEVNLSPSTAPQGGAAKIVFQVENDRPGVITKQVEVQFPQDTPIAEIYPMSVAAWAPIATSRKLDQAVAGIHSDGLDIVTSKITWIRADDAPKSAPPVENFTVELGPLPTVDELVLTVIQTYSDGTVKRWSGPSADGAGAGTVLKLQAAEAAAGPEAAEEVAAAPAAESGNTGAQLGLIGAGIVAGVLVSALAVVTIGSRFRTDRAAEEKTEEKPEPKAEESKAQESKAEESKAEESKVEDEAEENADGKDKAEEKADVVA